MTGKKTPQVVFGFASLLILFGILNGFYLVGSALRANQIIALDVFFQLLLPLVAYRVLRTSFGLSPRDLGLAIDKDLRSLIEESIACTALWLAADWFFGHVSWALLWQVDWIMTSKGFSYREVLPSGELSRFAVFLYLIVTAAIVEEVVYRSAMCFLFKSYKGADHSRWAFMFTSASLWAVAHWERGVAFTVQMLIVGLIAARLYLWTRNIWPLIVAHFVAGIVFF